MTTPQQAGDLIRRVIEMGYYNPDWRYYNPDWRYNNPDWNHIHGHSYMCHAITAAQEELTAEERKHTKNTKNMIYSVMSGRSAFMVSAVLDALAKTYGCTNTITRKTPAMSDGLMALFKDWERIHSDPSKILRYFTPYVYTG